MWRDTKRLSSAQEKVCFQVSSCISCDLFFLCSLLPILYTSMLGNRVVCSFTLHRESVMLHTLTPQKMQQENINCPRLLSRVPSMLKTPFHIKPQFHPVYPIRPFYPTPPMAHIPSSHTPSHFTHKTLFQPFHLILIIIPHSTHSTSTHFTPNHRFQGSSNLLMGVGNHPMPDCTSGRGGGLY